MALKNMLDLTCDPLAGLVEVPCIKRNTAGAANALTAAEMALAVSPSVRHGRFLSPMKLGRKTP